MDYKTPVEYIESEGGAWLARMLDDPQHSDLKRKFLECDLLDLSWDDWLHLQVLIDLIEANDPAGKGSWAGSHEVWLRALAKRYLEHPDSELYA